MLLASHTGSGKTLAYLLPLVRPAAHDRVLHQHKQPALLHYVPLPLAACDCPSILISSLLQVKLLKDAEAQGEERAKPKRPRAIILGPTRELTDQILGVAKSMSHFAKFRSACVNGGETRHMVESALTLCLSYRRDPGLVSADGALGGPDACAHL